MDTTMAWIATQHDRAIHVLPVGDLIEHDTSSTDCACGPNLTIGENGEIWATPIVTHHSLDGRELQEVDYQP